MCSDSEKNMSAFADQNHAPSLTCVRLELEDDEIKESHIALINTDSDRKYQSMCDLFYKNETVSKVDSVDHHRRKDKIGWASFCCHTVFFGVK